MPNRALFPVAAPVTAPPPSSPLTAADVALVIGSRREELMRLTPAAITLCAASVVAFHDAINGSLTTALRSRSESYAREQGTGKRALTIEDVCELAVAGGAEGARAVRALFAPIISRLDERGGAGDVNLAASDFLREACDVPNALLLGKDDSAIRKEINEAREMLRRAEKSIDERARVAGGRS